MSRPTVLERALRHLYEVESTTCQRAEREIGARYFNTSVSTIQRDLGIPVCREPRKMTNTHGEHYWAKVYWLDESGREATAHQLAAWERMREESEEEGSIVEPCSETV
ncbi:hypothetical protein [Halomonas sp. LBP4]|uniref:hypothetical protein n=1 Tax=Halomonas sp. LBP4 TaxID=2044917 RepID=UPI000D7724B1|nr:hypothetical protein [Halomonas sp. LBP4]PXX94986.1 hypothetical protein CR157_20440 [Halomonas sp. LBP4]